MKTIDYAQIKNTVRDLFLSACVTPDAGAALLVERAWKAEQTPHAKEILRQLRENNRIAEKEGIPACQDTGMAVVFLDVGQDVCIRGGFVEDAVNEGVREAYATGYFRKSVLDPLTRENTGDNTPAVLHTRIVPGGEVTVTAVPKGFGSENMSRIAMLKPSDGRQGIVDFVVESARMAGGSPCPPVFLGIGIGGTFESCALLAKRQLLRDPLRENPDGALREMEQEIVRRVNAMKMGPMGLGGDAYCLAALAGKAPTHIAGLPVAVNFCCHMLRHKTAVL